MTGHGHGGMARRRTLTLGPALVSTCPQGAGAPLVDGAMSCEAGGPRRWGSLVVRPLFAGDRPCNALVIGWEGVRPPSPHLWRRRLRAALPATGRRLLRLPPLPPKARLDGGGERPA